VLLYWSIPTQDLLFSFDIASTIERERERQKIPVGKLYSSVPDAAVRAGK
jgi:hypothetical protein